TLFPYTTLFRSAKGTTRVSARSCGAVRFGRPPTSQAVAAVHPSRSSASTSNSSRRHTDRPKDAYGVPAILPRPEGRDLPRTGSGDECAERRFGAVSFSACSTGCGTRFNLAKLSSRCPGWLALLIFSPTMTGKNESGSPIKLALELLKRIPRDRYVTAPDLHRQLEAAGIVRSRRTIERQLESLVEEFDIERDDRSKP